MWSYLIVRHSRSMNTLSIARPTPSIEMATPASSRTLMNAVAVNCLGSTGGSNTRLEIRAQRQVTLNAAYEANPIRFRRLAPKAPSIPELVWINPPELEVMAANN